MPRTARHLEMVTLFMLGVDIALIFASVIVANGLVYGATGANLGVDLVVSNIKGFLLVILMWFLVGTTQGMFVSHREDPLLYQMYQTVKSVIMTMALTFVLITFTAGDPPDVAFSLIFTGVAMVALCGFRLVLCLSLWNLRQHGYDARQILLVGANQRTMELARLLQRNQQYGYRIVGYLEDEEERCHHLKQLGIPRLGGFDDLEQVMRSVVIDELHVGLPVRSYYATIQSMADLCLGVGVSLRLVADIFPLKIAKSRIHQIEGVPMLSLTMVNENQAQLAVKRLVDITVAGTLLLVLAPLFAAVALLIKCTSPGPVFFYQERVGLNQRKFNMIKFRSMVADAEEKRDEFVSMNEADGPIFKIRNDPRITPVGRFLRKYSIDELPQLINVLRGEMSLVGPRPHPTKEVENYNWHHRRRLSVKPGMTGLAQVSGRSDLSWDDAVELDLRYIDGWDIFTDFYILMRTFRAVLAAHGAT
jgi:exopolysaccharide biosynthesis polyprenyl glycosylphosphotransferase